MSDHTPHLIDRDTAAQLLEKARRAREMSYTPYSRCRVGAALLSAAGTVTLGCNIENASYGSTVCAERVAVFKAVSDGERVFRAIAIVGGKGGRTTGKFPPCGICRQVLREFCRPEQLCVILEQADGSPLMLTLADLLPYSFGPDYL